MLGESVTPRSVVLQVQEQEKGTREARETRVKCGFRRTV